MLGTNNKTKIVLGKDEVSTPKTRSSDERFAETLVEERTRKNFEINHGILKNKLKVITDAKEFFRPGDDDNGRIPRQVSNDQVRVFAYPGSPGRDVSLEVPAKWPPEIRRIPEMEGVRQYRQESLNDDFREEHHRYKPSEQLQARPSSQQTDQHRSSVTNVIRKGNRIRHSNDKGYPMSQLASLELTPSGYKPQANSYRSQGTVSRGNHNNGGYVSDSSPFGSYTRNVNPAGAAAAGGRLVAENSEGNSDAVQNKTKVGVKVHAVVVPAFVNRGDTVKLECKYDMAVFNLYSLRWYHNDVEIFRFLPSDTPSKFALPINGVNIDEVNSTGATLILRNVSIKNGGYYKCEVLSEAPGYYTADRIAEMLVVDVPEKKPSIQGTRNLYHIGDRARMTCISAKSQPQADLTWYINNKEVPPVYLHELPPQLDSQGLQQSRLALEFPVTREHYSRGTIELRCSARIPNLYSQDRTPLVHGQLTYHVPVVAARDGSYAGSSMSQHHHCRCYCYLPVLVSVLVQVAVLQYTVSTSAPGTLLILSAAVLLTVAGNFTKTAGSANVVLSWIISLLAARNIIPDLVKNYSSSSRWFGATAELSGGSNNHPSEDELSKVSHPHSNLVCVVPVAPGSKRRSEKPERGRFNHQYGRPSNAGGGRTMASFSDLRSGYS